MKILLLLFVLFLSQTPLWRYDLEQAKSEAKKENKLILLSFAGSDWCAPCIRQTRDIFEKDTFIQYASQSLVLVKADFPRAKKNKLEDAQVKRNEALAEKYNPQGKFPLTLLLTASGKVLKTWDGYKPTTPEDFIYQINQATGGK